MDANQAATWQAWAGVAQAVGAILALGVSVAAPIIQRRAETKVRLKVKQGFAWIVSNDLTSAGLLFSSVGEDVERREASLGFASVAISVENHSLFPVEIRDIGAIEGRRAKPVSSFLMANKGKPFSVLPMEIRPLGSSTFVFNDSVLEYGYTDRTLAYVKIGNGTCFYSSANAWRKLAELCRKRNEGQRLVVR